MRDQLIRYVDLLFAGAPQAAEIKQEILQNTLDRYEDLVNQGKSPQAAYSLAISGIGDVSELLQDAPQLPQIPYVPTGTPVAEEYTPPSWTRIVRIVAIFLYIISIIPLIILSEMGMDTLGLCATIAVAAVATVLILIAGLGSKSPKVVVQKEKPLTPRQEKERAISKVISTVGLAVYLVISFLSGAWHITWLIFPIEAAINGIVRACLDLKEGKQYEN